MLGLTGISQAGGGEVKGRAVATPAAGQAGVYTPQGKIFKVYSDDFQVRPGDGMEMKFHMQKGAGMVYAWKANGKLTYEFHGEPDQKPTKDYFESYDLDDKVGKESAYGSFTAPSTGIHGWFWKNSTDKEVQFHLNVSGFFDSAKMFAGSPTGEDVQVDDAK
jgi:hypothetical protein